MKPLSEDPALPDPAHPDAAGQSRQAFLKLACEMGPLLVFFAANLKAGLMTATAVFMGASVIAVAVSWFLLRRLPIAPFVSGILVLVFGGATLLLQDETVLKLKPTLVNGGLGLFLLGALLLGRSPLPRIFGAMVRLDALGWRRLTLRWGVFFLGLACLNEIVRHVATTDQWVSFRVFGLVPLVLVFAVCQVPLMQRHQLPDPDVVPGEPGE